MSCAPPDFTNAEVACPRCRAEAPHVYGRACLYYTRSISPNAEQWSCFNCGLLAFRVLVDKRWEWHEGSYEAFGAESEEVKA